MSRLLFLFSSLVFVMSCQPYLSEVPLGKVGKSHMDEALLGKWYAAGLEKNGFKIHHAVEIHPIDNAYALNHIVFEKNGRAIKGVDMYRLDPCTIDKINYFNLRELTTHNTNKYSIWKYNSLIPGHANVRFLTDSLSQIFPTSKAFTNYVKGNSQEFDNYFSKKSIPYIRIENISWNFSNILKTESLTSLQLFPEKVGHDRLKIFSDEQLNQMGTVMNKEQMTDLQTIFKKVHLIDYPALISQKSRWGFLQFENKEIIRLQIVSLKGETIILHDLTNNWWYKVPKNLEEKWTSLMNSITPIKIRGK